VAAIIAASVEETAKAAEAALLGTRIFAYWDADANAFADRVSFANRNLLAYGHRNLFDNFLLLVADGLYLLLLYDFLGNLLGYLDLANFFAWLPNFDLVGLAGNSFLNVGIFREQVLQAAEAALLGTRIVAGVGTRIAFVFTNADLLAHGLARVSSLFANPLASKP
jgi:hypothetical protein